MTIAIFAASVWFIPGWLRSETPDSSVMRGLRRTFPDATIEFKAWDGEYIFWPTTVDAADRESRRFAHEIATMPAARRATLTLVGHSLGGRIVVRVMAQLAKRGIKIRQAILMGAAIPSDDQDLAKMGLASVLPVLALCNPNDFTLRYVYATVGGEGNVAYGANGTLTPCANVIECVMPADLAQVARTSERRNGKIAVDSVINHHESFYIEFAKRILAGATPSSRVMVPQGFPTLEGRVTDGEKWWDVLDAASGWKLERHKITGLCRILDPDKTRKAWGRKADMFAAFAKVKRQLGR